MTTGSAMPSLQWVIPTCSATCQSLSLPVRIWIRGEFRPTVVCADADLEVYELLDQVQRLQTRVKMQAAIVALLMRVLRNRGGKLDLTRLADGKDKSSLLRTLGPASIVLGIDSALKIVGLSRARFHAWRRRDAGCGLDDLPSCPKSFPTRLTRAEVGEMKHAYLFTQVLDSLEAVTKHVDKYVVQHNSVVGRAIFDGKTPDEIYAGTETMLPERLAEERSAAHRARVAWNRSSATTA